MIPHTWIARPVHMTWGRPRVEQANDAQQRTVVPFLFMACQALIVVAYLTRWTSHNLYAKETLSFAPPSPVDPNSVG